MEIQQTDRIVYRLILALGVGLTGQAQPLLADDSFKPVYRPTLEVSRKAGEIEIDGDLSDSGWHGAARATNFAENHPGDQTKPPVETGALMTYDEHSLYVAFVCYDDPKAVRASFCPREQVFSDDNIGLFFDTYGDAAWAYILNVNPRGIQYDAVWSSNAGEDAAYDLVWESVGKVTDSGYQIELAIPFASLRFPNKPIQTWKVDFWRHQQRDSHHQYSWAAYDRDEPCWPCQWGTVTGIENVQPGKGIEMLPAAVAFQSGALSGNGTPDSPFGFENDDPDGEVSLSAKYSAASNITAEATYNPDFSQVEADPAQIDVNTTFALFYDERRPFFQEGSDLFNTMFDAVYTRSINDPLLAAKLTGRLNRSSIAYLVARDEHSPIILPFEERSRYLLTGKSTSNIMRARQSFGEDSRVGVLVTDRRLDGGGSGTLLSSDGTLRLSKNYRFEWQVISSHTEEPDDTMLTYDPHDTLFNSMLFDGAEHTAAFDGESFWGHAYYADISRKSRHVVARATYREYSPTFRADNGFEPKNDQREVSGVAQYTFFLDNSLVQRIILMTTGRTSWNFDGQKKQEILYLNLSGQLGAGQTDLHSQYWRAGENLGGIQFDDLWNLHLCAHGRPSDLLALSTYANYGRLIARLEDPPVAGHETTLGFDVDVKPVDRLLLGTSYTYARSNHADTDEKLFETFITRTRLNYQFTRELSLRLVVQYDYAYKTWDIDPLLTYQLNPFSIFYIGSAYDYERFDGLGADGSGRSTRLKSRQFFLKLQYLFQV